MINFEQIMDEMISKGLVIERDAIAATKKVVRVEGEWRSDGTARIIKTSAGWKVGDFAKTLPVSFEVPGATNFEEGEISEGLKTLFPDAEITIRIL